MLTKNYLAIYAKSFNWAGFFLPKKTYQKCSALYDFCREADNIADDENKIEVKKDNFIKFRNNFVNKNYDDPVIKNMWDLVNEFNISTKIIDDLFEGINSDIKENVKLNSKKELLIYSYRVAGTVGLMMAKILNVQKKQSLKSAIDLGIAMQLTNISRDVMEDKKNNRIYINESFEDIKNTIKLSEQFYKNSFYSIKEIPLSFRFSILVARRVYRKIGYKILNKQNIENYKKSEKIYVSNIEKIIETFVSIFDLIKLSLISKNDDNINHDHNLINEEINEMREFDYIIIGGGCAGLS
jgi:Phytoene/squalene synthetase